MESYTHRWKSLQDCLDVIEGRDNRIGMSKEILEYYLIRNLLEEDDYRSPNDMYSFSDAWSIIKNKLRNSKIDIINGDDKTPFTIELPRGEVVQLIPDENTMRVGVKRIGSEEITWIKIYSYPRGITGSTGYPGPLGSQVLHRGSKY